jgi:hypothetical protein
MVKRNDRARRPSKERSPALGPYQVMPAENAPRQAPERAATGAILVFAAAVVGPVVLLAIREVLFGLRFGWNLPTIAGAIKSTGAPPAVELLLAVVLLLGARGLLARGRDHGISGELAAATWLAVVANAATFLVIGLTTWGEDSIAYDFFEAASRWTVHAAEAFLALAAARHFLRVGRSDAATAGRWLAAALPAASVAGYLLKRTTYDDMFVALPPRHAALVLPIEAALWAGKLVLFGALYLALTKRIKEQT